jgi:hypothetical protein
MKASGNLRFLVIHMFCRVNMAPIHVGTDRQVIIWSQTHFALRTLASVDTNTIMQSLRLNVKIGAKFSEALAPVVAFPSTTHRICLQGLLLTLTNIVCHSLPYFISVPKFYVIQVPAGSDIWHWSEKIRYTGFTKKYNEEMQTGLNWIRAGSNVWPLTSW